MAILRFTKKYSLRKVSQVSYEVHPSHRHILHLNMNYFIYEQEDGGQGIKLLSAIFYRIEKK